MQSCGYTEFEKIPTDKRYFIQDGKTYDILDLYEGFVVKGNIDLSGLGLTRLPDLSHVVVLGAFDCSDNKLKSLNGAPKYSVVFNAANNATLRNLYGMNGAKRLIVSGCNLKQIVGLQDKVAELDCSGNKGISFEGLPKNMNKLVCHNCDLTSLTDIPETIEEIRCMSNKKLYISEEDREKYKNIDCPDYRQARALFYEAKRRAKAKVISLQQKIK